MNEHIRKVRKRTTTAWEIGRLLDRVRGRRERVEQKRKRWEHENMIPTEKIVWIPANGGLGVHY